MQKNRTCWQEISVSPFQEGLPTKTSTTSPLTRRARLPLSIRNWLFNAVNKCADKPVIRVSPHKQRFATRHNCVANLGGSYTWSRVWSEELINVVLVLPQRVKISRRSTRHLTSVFDDETRRAAFDNSKAFGNTVTAEQMLPTMSPLAVLHWEIRSKSAYNL